MPETEVVSPKRQPKPDLAAEAERIFAEPKTIGQKILAVMADMGEIKKEGWNVNQKYPFVQEVTIANELRPLLVKHGLLIHQTVKEWGKSPVDPRITTVVYTFQIIDAETGEVWPPSDVLVDGMDGGDKGPNKASTTAFKFHALRTFCIGAGTKEDAEADETTDKMVAAGEAAAGPVRVTRGSQAGVQRGGKSALITMTQVNSIARLARDAGLDADGTAAVVARVIGSEPAEGLSLREWLGTFTSEQAKAILEALSVGQGVDTAVDSVDKAATNGTEEVGKEVSETIAVV